MGTNGTVHTNNNYRKFSTSGEHGTATIERTKRARNDGGKKLDGRRSIPYINVITWREVQPKEEI